MAPKAMDIIHAYGHEKILATHKSTFEITRDRSITERGDCIVAIASSKGLRDLKDDLKRLLRIDKSKITVIIKANGIKETVSGRGNKSLTLNDPNDLVCRKSDFICDRTLMIKADKSASDFDRSFIESIRNPKIRIKIELVAETKG
jgi:hypothetical protein